MTSVLESLYRVHCFQEVGLKGKKCDAEFWAVTSDKKQEMARYCSISYKECITRFKNLAMTLRSSLPGVNGLEDLKQTNSKYILLLWLYTLKIEYV